MENRRWHERTLAARSYPVKARGKALVEAAHSGEFRTPESAGEQIARRVGNQREKKKRSDAEENEREDFVPGVVFYSAGHWLQ